MCVRAPSIWELPIFVERALITSMVRFSNGKSETKHTVFKERR